MPTQSRTERLARAEVNGRTISTVEITHDSATGPWSTWETAVFEPRTSRHHSPDSTIHDWPSREVAELGHRAIVDGLTSKTPANYAGILVRDEIDTDRSAVTIWKRLVWDTGAYEDVFSTMMLSNALEADTGDGRIRQELWTCTSAALAGHANIVLELRAEIAQEATPM